MCSIKEALQKAASFLRRQGVDAPRREAELMLAFLLAQETVYLYAHGEEGFPATLWAEYEGMLQRRGQGIPLAYLTGEKEFMGLPFGVKEGVLIPRPETEHLVETVLQWCNKVFPRVIGGRPLHILDLGTGSGNIAVSLAYFLPEAYVLGVDSSGAALELAQCNAKKNGVEARVEFFYGDFQVFFGQNRQSFHVVVSNPPYIPRPEISSLPPSVQKEPLLALNGGEDGLDSYRVIFSSIRGVLTAPGLLALEVGGDQAGAVQALGYRAGFADAGIVQDLAGRERVLVFQS